MIQRGLLEMEEVPAVFGYDLAGEQDVGVNKVHSWLQWGNNWQDAAARNLVNHVM